LRALRYQLSVLLIKQRFQRISTPEFGILTVLLLRGGGVFWYYLLASKPQIFVFIGLPLRYLLSGHLRWEAAVGGTYARSIVEDM